MSSGQIEVLLPCDVLTVDVQLGSKAQTSPIQRIILEAIQHKCGTILEISHLLGIPHRPIMDVLLEFWRSGYILLDLEYHNLQLSPEGAALLHTSKGRPIEETELVVSVDILQERVSGTLIPYMRAARSSNDLFSAPRLIESQQYSRISNASVRDVLNRSAAVRSLRRNYKVLGFTFRRAPMMQSLRSENLPITLRVSVTAGGALDVEMLLQASVTAFTARSIGENLGKFVSCSSDHTFGQLLKAEASRSVESEPRTLDANLGAIRSILTEVKALGLIELTADRIAHLGVSGAKTATELEYLERCQSSCGVILDAGELWRAIKKLIESPYRQLIICLPEYDTRRFQEVIALVKGSFGIGPQAPSVRSGTKGIDKRVYILWGRAESDVPTFQHKQMLSELEKASRAIHVASQSCSIENGFVVRDDQEALIFDARHLRDHMTTPLVAIRLTPRREARGTGTEYYSNAPSATLVGLLEWIRHLHPDYDAGRLIKISFEEPGEFDDQPSIPADLFGSHSFTAASDTVRTTVFENWLLTWDDLARRFESRRKRLSSVALIMQDAQINDAILAMLQHGRSVLLGWGGVDHRTFSGSLLEKLEDRCIAGHNTTIIASLTRGSDWDKVLAPVIKLTNRYPGLLVLTERDGWRGLCVVHSDEAVLGPGLTWRAQPSGRPASRSLAVWVKDPQFASRVISEIGKGLLDADLERPTYEAREDITLSDNEPFITPRQFEWAANYRLAEDLNARRTLMRELRDLTQDIEADLVAIERQLPTVEFCELLSRMVAGGLLGAETQPRWAAKLGASLWQAGRFFESYLLARVAGAEYAKPPLWLSELSLGLTAEVPIIIRPSTEREIEAALIACTLGLCFHGESGLRLVFEQLIDSAPNGPLLELAKLFRDYWDSCQTRVPMHQSTKRQVPATETTDLALERYLKVAEESTEMMLKSKPCSMVMQKLFSRDGPIGALTSALKGGRREQQREAAATWIKRYGTDASKFLSSAESTIQIKGKRVKVVGERRNFMARYFSKLMSAIDALAKSTLDSPRDTVSGGEVDGLREGVMRLGPEIERWIENSEQESFASPLVRNVLRAINYNGGASANPN
jgi:hypothetical protein